MNNAQFNPFPNHPIVNGAYVIGDLGNANINFRAPIQLWNVNAPNNNFENHVDEDEYNYGNNGNVIPDVPINDELQGAEINNAHQLQGVGAIEARICYERVLDPAAHYRNQWIYSDRQCDLLKATVERQNSQLDECRYESIAATENINQLEEDNARLKAELAQMIAINNREREESQFKKSQLENEVHRLDQLLKQVVTEIRPRLAVLEEGQSARERLAEAKARRAESERMKASEAFRIEFERGGHERCQKRRDDKAHRIEVAELKKNLELKEKEKVEAEQVSGRLAVHLNAARARAQRWKSKLPVEVIREEEQKMREEAVTERRRQQNDPEAPCCNLRSAKRPRVENQK